MLGCLTQQVVPVDQDINGVALIGRPFGYVTENYSLAAARAQHQNRCSASISICGLDFIDSLGLIISEGNQYSKQKIYSKLKKGFICKQ